GSPGTRPRRPGRGYIRESGSILHVVGMGVKRIGTELSLIFIYLFKLIKTHRVGLTDLHKSG
ncbi:MAG: hypothetical protein QF732_12260, partial [Nitrospinaceae bacterium]|nr:hypothetical protein [Nitrospinaceae bacterium]